MRQPRSRYRLISLLFGAALWSGPAASAPSLAEAIGTADAKYLGAEEVVPKGDAPKMEGGSGEEETEPTDQEIAQGKVRATLTYKESKTEEGETERVPVVTVFADGEQVAQIEGQSIGSFDPPVSVQIAEVDPANASPEVVVSFYTGGAHCCSDTKLITSNKDGSSWQTVEIGQFDGGPLLATDLAGDGRYVFETRDNAFLYAFGCYACSTAPLRILAVEDGEVKTVSGDPAYRPVHEAYMGNIIINAVPEEDVNGFLAGYVGEKSLLGEGKEAWQLMLAYYDRSSDWGLDVCDQPLDAEGACPGTTERLTFPEALERMLNENGYKVEK
ncbi:MAG: hypothetical protein WBB88_02715 [Methyloceanibacter sp.]